MIGQGLLLMGTLLAPAAMPDMRGVEDDKTVLEHALTVASDYGWLTACHAHPHEALYQLFKRQGPDSQLRTGAAHAYAACLIEQGHERIAMSFLKPLLDSADTPLAGPHRVLLLTDLGLAHMRIGEHEPAASAFREALSLEFDGENAARLALLLHLEASNRDTATLEERLALLDGARAWLAKAIASADKGSTSHGSLLLELALLELTAGQLDSDADQEKPLSLAAQAINVLERRVEQGGSATDRALLTDGYANMALLLKLQKANDDEALRYARLARATAPNQRLQLVLDRMLAPVEGRERDPSIAPRSGEYVALEDHAIHSQ